MCGGTAAHDGKHGGNTSNIAEGHEIDVLPLMARSGTLSRSLVDRHNRIHLTEIHVARRTDGVGLQHRLHDKTGAANQFRIYEMSSKDSDPVILNEI